jgi:hypothetical protein
MRQGCRAWPHWNIIANISRDGCETMGDVMAALASHAQLMLLRVAADRLQQS